MIFLMHLNCLPSRDSFLDLNQQGANGEFHLGGEVAPQSINTNDSFIYLRGGGKQLSHSEIVLNELCCSYGIQVLFMQ